MFKFLTILFLVSTISFSALASHTDEEDNVNPTPTPELGPQPEAGPFQKLPMLIDCSSAEATLDMIKRYEEVPFLQMEVSIQIPGGSILKQPGVMFMNTRTLTWTLVALFPETNGACVLQNGIGITPVNPNSGT
jgi:hypothetical protein